jgi:alpha-beta hydrolase superfamily lysophospholipase
MKVRFEDPQFAFQFLRVLGSAASHLADVGECFATAARIVEGDFESWTRAWTRTAERVEFIADACAAKGHRVSAGDSYMRASNYFRSAEFYLHGTPSDPRIRELSERSARCFLEGLRALDVRFERTAVAYEGTTLPGIFYPAGTDRRRTLLVQTGFDGTMEGLYPWALAATRRGWHCFTFEGPGQGQVIRTQGLPFRPDWERVVGPVIDHVVARRDVDAQRVALLGVSFGGLLAPRAAAFDHRLAACIANGGVLDFISPRIPKGTTREEMVGAIRQAPEQVDAAMRQAAAKSPEARWGQENGIYTFQASSPSDWLRKLLDYDLTPYAKQIQCPTLVVDVEHENSFPGEAKKLYDALTCPKTWVYFTEDEGAGDHCQTGSPTLGQQRILDWLDETVRAAAG